MDNVKQSLYVLGKMFNIGPGYTLDALFATTTYQDIVNRSAYTDWHAGYIKREMIFMSELNDLPPRDKPYDLNDPSVELAIKEFIRALDVDVVQNLSIPDAIKQRDDADKKINWLFQDELRRFLNTVEPENWGK